MQIIKNISPTHFFIYDTFYGGLEVIRLSDCCGYQIQKAYDVNGKGKRYSNVSHYYVCEQDGEIVDVFRSLKEAKDCAKGCYDMRNREPDHQVKE